MMVMCLFLKLYLTMHSNGIDNDDANGGDMVLHVVTIL